MGRVITVRKNMFRHVQLANEQFLFESYYFFQVRRVLVISNPGQHYN